MLIPVRMMGRKEQHQRKNKVFSKEGERGFWGEIEIEKKVWVLRCFGF